MAIMPVLTLWGTISVLPTMRPILGMRSFWSLTWTSLATVQRRKAMTSRGTVMPKRSRRHVRERVKRLTGEQALAHMHLALGQYALAQQMGARDLVRHERQ